LSSREFSSELIPEATLYRLLLTTGAASMALGLTIILYLPVDPWVCAAGAAAWCYTTGREIAVIWFSHKRFSGLRIFADGSAELRTTDGRRLAATIARGSLVLPQWAWLILRLADGRAYLALLRGDARQSKQWRRLQVIWRHLGTAGRSC
jgi:hypothetical protein